MSVPRKKPVFQPVIMIPTAEQTELDKAVIAWIGKIQRFIASTMETARSKQKRIGVSEFGDPCRKCVARKLAQVEMVDDPSWKAQIGTFGHAGLEEHFLAMYPWMYDVTYVENADAPGGWEKIITVKPELVATDEQPLFHLEQRVVVGRILRHDFLLDGSCDLFIEGATFGIVTDWKFQGATSLKKSGSGKIGVGYHTQMNGYGLGWAMRGKLVTHVLLYALPRDDELEAAKPVLHRFDATMPTAALERLGELMDAAALVGWDAVIEAQPTDPGCWDCGRYEQAERNFDRMQFFDMMVGGS